MAITDKLCKKLGGEWYSFNEEYGANACVGIDLTWANLPKANLGGANLSYSNLYRADFSKSFLFKANFSDSELGAVKLNEEAVKSLLEIKPDYDKEGKEQIKKNKELIKQELLLGGV